jgi:GNAT superfamily N-acetyltransferase
MAAIQVEPVQDRAGLRAFVRFPETLYRGDPRWVAPLRRDEEEKLSPRNPYFDHAEARLFLARREGGVVGRLAAIVDRWHLERWKDGTGLFGFFEAVDDAAVAAALFAEVEGRPVGFFLCLPDLNPALRHLHGRMTPWGVVRFLLARRRLDTVRLILLGVLPAYRRRGIEALLIARAWEAVYPGGYRFAEVGWILEDNAVTRQATARWNARLVKKYRLYETSLAD